MDNTANIILIAVFGALGVWLMIEYFKTKDKVVIQDKRWTPSRILFVGAAVLAVASALLYTTVMDYIRLGVMVLCIVAFLLVHDGVGKEGFVSFGHYTPWSDVKGYDTRENKKNYEVIFTGIDKESKKLDEFHTIVTFSGKQKEEVDTFLSETIGKKHRRMKF